MATAPGWTTRSRVTSSPSSWRKRSTRTLNMRPAYTSSPPVCLNTAQLLPKHGAPGDRGAEEQLVLVQRAAHRTAREAARAVALEVGHGRNELVVRQRLAALEPVGQGGGDRDGDRAQEEAEHRRTVVGNPAMARARVAGGHAGNEHGPRAEGEAHVRDIARGEAAVPERAPRADDAGPGADDRGVPTERVAPCGERASHRDRLVLAPKGLPGGDVPSEQAARAQLADRAREAAREGAAQRLHEPHPCPRAPLSRRPRDRLELAVEREHGDRPAPEVRRSPSAGRPARLDPVDGVLQGGVVELDRAPFLPARTSGLGPASEAACQVDVNDVEPATGQAEVERQRIDDDLVARLGLTGEAAIGDRRAPLAVHLDRQLDRRPAASVDRRDHAAPQREPHRPTRATIPRATSSTASSDATLTRSSGRWLSIVPSATFRHGRPAALRTLASLPAAVARRTGS